MSEELKLLKAMCGALGLEVKRDVMVTLGTFKRKISFPVFGVNPFPEWEESKFVGNGEYVEVKREVIYTVTPIALDLSSLSTPARTINTDAIITGTEKGDL